MQRRHSYAWGFSQNQCQLVSECWDLGLSYSLTGGRQGFVYRIDLSSKQNRTGLIDISGPIAFRSKMNGY